MAEDFDSGKFNLTGGLGLQMTRTDGKVQIRVTGPTSTLNAANTSEKVRKALADMNEDGFNSKFINSTFLNLVNGINSTLNKDVSIGTTNLNKQQDHTDTPDRTLSQLPNNTQFQPSSVLGKVSKSNNTDSSTFEGDLALKEEGSAVGKTPSSRAHIKPHKSGIEVPEITSGRNASSTNAGAGSKPDHSENITSYTPISASLATPNQNLTTAPIKTSNATVSPSELKDGMLYR